MLKRYVIGKTTIAMESSMTMQSMVRFGMWMQIQMDLVAILQRLHPVLNQLDTLPIRMIVMTHALKAVQLP